MTRSIRREGLDHVMVLQQTGVQRVWKSYFQYYERTHTHLSLEKDAPTLEGYNLENSEKWWSFGKRLDSTTATNAARPSLPGSVLC